MKDSVENSDKTYVLGLFVDFPGAFDNLTWSCVVEKLVEVGYEELDLWKSYFANRKACVRGKNEVRWTAVERGCPQGSICGPFVWKLLLDALLVKLEGMVKVCAYADNLVILVEGNTRRELEDIGTAVMLEVSEWGNRVEVAVSKYTTVQNMLLKGRLDKEQYESISVFAKEAFARRRLVVRNEVRMNEEDVKEFWF